MERGRGPVLCLVLLVLLVAAGFRQLESSSWLGLDVGLGEYTATEKPFAAFPLVQVGFHRAVFKSWRLGATLGYARWSDYLNMYGGKFTFACLRPAVELTFLFPALLSSVVTSLAGVGLGYNAYRIRNALGNAYPGGLKDHVFFSTFAGADFSLGEKGRGIARNVFLSARLRWNVSGDFSGLRGALGLGVKLR